LCGVDQLSIVTEMETGQGKRLMAVVLPEGEKRSSTGIQNLNSAVLTRVCNS